VDDSLSAHKINGEKQLGSDDPHIVLGYANLLLEHVSKSPSLLELHKKVKIFLALVYFKELE
jgi:hypothetical protein